MREAIIAPLREIYGVSDKVLTMALSSVLLGAPKKLRLWREVGAGILQKRRKQGMRCVQPKLDFRRFWHIITPLWLPPTLLLQSQMDRIHRLSILLQLRSANPTYPVTW